MGQLENFNVANSILALGLPKPQYGNNFYEYHLINYDHKKRLNKAVISFSLVFILVSLNI